MGHTGIAGPASAFALCVAAIVFHELGHWIAMRRAGIEIDAIGIGFSPPKCRRWSKTICGMPFIFGILPVMVYLRRTKEGQQRLQSLPYHEQSLIYGAGVMANVFLSTIVLDFLLMAYCGEPWKVVYLPFFWKITIPAVLIWFGRRYFCGMLPLIGVAVAAWLTAVSLHSPNGLGLVGPVGLAGYLIHGSPTLRMGIIQGAIASLMWGGLNSLPLVPADGWHTFAAFLHRHKPGWVQLIFDAEFAIYILILIVALGNDFHL